VWSLKRHLLRDLNSTRYADRLKHIDLNWERARYAQPPVNPT
jgi:hypothetical protein